MTSDASPTLIADRYMILRPTGVANGVKSFLAQDVSGDRLVRVKQIPLLSSHEETADENAEVLLRLQKAFREVNVLQSLSHPNVVKCLDSYVEERRNTKTRSTIRSGKNVTKAYVSLQRVITLVLEHNWGATLEHELERRFDEVAVDEEAGSDYDDGFLDSDDENTTRVTRAQKHARAKSESKESRLSRNSTLFIPLRFCIADTLGEQTTDEALLNDSLRRSRFSGQQQRSGAPPPTSPKYLEVFQSKRGRLSVLDAWLIFIQVLMGLKAVHRNRLVHRDLQPTNIYISPDAVVRLANFGIITHLAGLTALPVDSQASLWSAPELLTDDGGTDYTRCSEKSDAWAAGCLALSLLMIGSGSHTGPFSSAAELMSYPEQAGAYREAWRKDLANLNVAGDGSAEDLLTLAEMLVHPVPDQRPTLNHVMSMPLVLQNYRRIVETWKEASYPQFDHIHRYWKGSISKKLSVIERGVRIKLKNTTVTKPQSLTKDDDDTEEPARLSITRTSRPSELLTERTDGRTAASMPLAKMGVRGSVSPDTAVPVLNWERFSVRRTVTTATLERASVQALTAASGSSTPKGQTKTLTSPRSPKSSATRQSTGNLVPSVSTQSTTVHESGAAEEGGSSSRSKGGDVIGVGLTREWYQDDYAMIELRWLKIREELQALESRSYKRARAAREMSRKAVDDAPQIYKPATERASLDEYAKKNRNMKVVSPRSYAGDNVRNTPAPKPRKHYDDVDIFGPAETPTRHVQRNLVPSPQQARRVRSWENEDLIEGFPESVRPSTRDTVISRHSVYRMPSISSRSTLLGRNTATAGIRRPFLGITRQSIQPSRSMDLFTSDLSSSGTPPSIRTPGGVGDSPAIDVSATTALAQAQTPELRWGESGASPTLAASAQQRLALSKSALKLRSSSIMFPGTTGRSTLNRSPPITARKRLASGVDWGS